jgi:hypothetical protein
MPLFKNKSFKFCDICGNKTRKSIFFPLLFCWIRDLSWVQRWIKIRIRDKNPGSATVVEQNLMFSFCSRELTYHFVKSGHKPTAAIACECGRRFHGGPSGAYRYHR